LLGEKLKPHLHQTVVVENKPGASGIIGTQFVASSKPDGYTVLIVSPSHVVNPRLMKTLPYDTVKDFSPVAKVGSVSAILYVNNGLGITSLNDFIHRAKENPGKLNYGSAGIGSLGDLAMRQLESQADVQLEHVAFNGVPALMTSLLRGDIQAAFISPSDSIAMYEAKKITALGIADLSRSGALPDIPTLAEAGLPGFEVNGWNALFVPADTPDSAIQVLNKAVNAALRDPALVSAFESRGVTPLGGSPEALQQSVNTDIKKFTAILDKAGVERY
jgi:tripartite-type tricarboxylate transporter receptor subunit TctC